MWEKNHPTTMRLIRYARERLGVEVHFIGTETAEAWSSRWSDHHRPFGVSRWPVHGGGFCTMGDWQTSSRGSVWLDETLCETCPTETSALPSLCAQDPNKVFLFSAVCHEIAHAVVGKEEEYATEYERALARTLGIVGSPLWRNLDLYAPSVPLPSHRRELIAQGILIRPAPRKAPLVRTSERTSERT